MMDEKGFSFTPLTFLIIIPIIIVAVAFSGIVNEINLISQIGIGGDVTYSAASNIFTSIEKGAKDGGRRAAYNATRTVIDNEALRKSNPFYASGTSKTAIKTVVADAINENTVKTCLEIQSQTGRQIYVNNILIDSYSDKPFNSSQINITQYDPYSFNVIIPGGIPISAVQKDQNATFKTPLLNVTVSIENLEDPYVWVKTKDRRSSVIYKYPYYTTQFKEYHFADTILSDNIANLNFCLNGTNNPSGITPRPYYFPDPNGLTFFDRLEGKSVSTDTPEGRMGTFILGQPLEDPGYLNPDGSPKNISSVDHEYFTMVPGSVIKVNGNDIQDPWHAVFGGKITPFYVSDTYLGIFGLKRNYP
ncbi:MAG TPA: hypothetical protein VK444_06925 [Methanobacteriaceae archaeon]|nr:hypothetical protein [Methanobacteriaceae archaeon]